MTIKLTAAEAKQLTKLSDALDQAKSDLLDYLTQLRDDWQAEQDEKSERWQESQAADEAQERIDQVEQLMDDVDQIDITIDIDALS